MEGKILTQTQHNDTFLTLPLVRGSEKSRNPVLSIERWELACFSGQFLSLPEVAQARQKPFGSPVLVGGRGLGRACW